MSADGKTSFKGGGAPAGSVGGEVGGGATNASPAQAFSIAECSALLSMPTKLSKDGEEYIEAIISKMSAEGFEPKVVTINGANYEARILEKNGLVTAFVFAETYVPDQNGNPIAYDVADDLRRRLGSHGISGNPKMFFVVTKEDYEKVDIMATTVINAYKCEAIPQLKNLTANAFSKGRFEVTDDVEIIRPFVEKMNPYATMPRMDCALMLYETIEKDNAFVFGNAQQKSYTISPVAIVTGFTDFTLAQNSSCLSTSDVKYNPYFVITGQFSKFVTNKIAAITIPLTAYLMIQRQFWTKQFSTYIKGKPNIGNLLLDRDTGKPYFAGDQMARNTVITNYLTAQMPTLAIDVQLGGFTMPGLGQLIDSAAEFNAVVDNFTGGSGATSIAKASQGITYHIDGRIAVGGKASKEFIDTRSIDYLSVVAAGFPQDQAAVLLRTGDTKERLEAVKNLYPEVNFLYTTYRAYLNPNWVIRVADDLAKSLRVRVNAPVESYSYDLGQLTSWSQAGISGMQSFAAANSAAGFSGSWGWC